MMNRNSSDGLAKANEKIRKKNEKNKKLKEEQEGVISDLHHFYNSKIKLLDKKLKKLHTVYEDYRDITESEVLLKDGII